MPPYSHPATEPGEPALLAGFRAPPRNFGPVPFYWWAGEPLDRERLAWQLDQLVAKGIHQVVISYPHRADGTTDPGDPPLFSPAWWDFFRWFLQACRARGMTAGFQDYTLVGPILQAIGRATPGMQGGQLSCISRALADGEQAILNAEAGALPVGAWAWPTPPEKLEAGQMLDLSAQIKNGNLTWIAPAGAWRVALVFARTNPFDPLHPDAGRLAIAQLYEPFARECPDELGRTLGIFFQDELDFGSRMPFWSDRLRSTFQTRHGYDLWPWLPALWHDLGPVTVKIRLDYADAVTARLESCYFEPVYRWHETRGTLFGHDNCGRGEMRTGRAHYGDYFRAMRWYSAPGCDDPKVRGERSFKGLKVNSSIAHLHQRPRVWAEAFHSSGWGATPAEIVGAFNEDFAYGATVVNLHGLYYTTLAGWWEWAPPDFHFRQPYWAHCAALNAYFSRLSWLLAQGVHRCDVAIVYPSAALEAEAADAAKLVVEAHVENSGASLLEAVSADPEAISFGLGRHLFDRACDFDFVDFESLQLAVTDRQELRIGDGIYRALILPGMATVRFSTLLKARDFVRAGGLVFACGCLPEASERQGADDEQVAALVEEIFGASPLPGDTRADRRRSHPSGGQGIFFGRGFSRVLSAIDSAFARDVVIPRGQRLHVLHRHRRTQDIYFLCNPDSRPFDGEIILRSGGAAEAWNPWTGEAASVPTRPGGGRRTIVPVALGPREARVLVFHPNRPAGTAAAPMIGIREFDTLDGRWDFTLRPTLDNRHGDFRQPAGAGFVGPEVARFRCTEEFSAPDRPAFANTNWPKVTSSFGPRLLVTPPLPPGTDFHSLERRLTAPARREAGPAPRWRPYSFSTRWGIERDPFLTHWLSGPHGLKGGVPDEFLDFHSSEAGTTWYLRTVISVDAAGEWPLVAGARCIYRIWVNGQSVIEQRKARPPGRYAPWNIPHYESVPRATRVQLQRGENHLLIKLVQPDAGQRTRAYFAFAPVPTAAPGPVLRWFTDPTVPRPTVPATAKRRAIWFRFKAPPGWSEMNFTAHGDVQAWSDDQPLLALSQAPASDGAMKYRVAAKLARPDCTEIALRIEAPRWCRGGAALPEPVRFTCGPGRLPAGDWSDHGLAAYSGIGEYRRPLQLSALPAGGQWLLDLGEVSATAAVFIDGGLIATLLAAPWQVLLPAGLAAGTHELCVQVANSLANFYSVGVPSPYAFPEQTRSGLLGPVRLRVITSDSPSPAQTPSLASAALLSSV